MKKKEYKDLSIKNYPRSSTPSKWQMGAKHQDFKLLFEFNPKAFDPFERGKLYDILNVALTYIKDSKSGAAPDIEHPFDYFYKRSRNNSPKRTV